MELRCPHCGKKQSLTPAELNASGGVVICPQCVSEFSVDITSVPEEPVAEPEAQTPAAEVAMKIAFCPTCGKHLPVKGLNFCPFCGAPLPLSDGGSVAHQAPATAAPQPTQPQEQAAATPKPVEETPEQKLASLPFVKTSHIVPRHHEPASWRFKIVAWIAIVVLIGLFVFMVWDGNLE